MRVFVNLVVVEKNYSKHGGETMCPNDGYVYFRNSELISGQLGKGTLGMNILICFNVYAFTQITYWMPMLMQEMGTRMGCSLFC